MKESNVLILVPGLGDNKPSVLMPHLTASAEWAKHEGLEVTLFCANWHDEPEYPDFVKTVASQYQGPAVKVVTSMEEDFDGRQEELTELIEKGLMDGRDVIAAGTSGGGLKVVNGSLAIPLDHDGLTVVTFASRLTEQSFDGYPPVASVVEKMRTPHFGEEIAFLTEHQLKINPDRIMTVTVTGDHKVPQQASQFPGATNIIVDYGTKTHHAGIEAALHSSQLRHDIVRFTKRNK